MIVLEIKGFPPANRYMMPTPRLALFGRIHARPCVWLLIAGLFLATANALAQAPPRIEKLDPPDWWLNQANPMLLVRGANLAKVRVKTDDPAVQVERVKESDTGRYLFVWLRIGPAAKSGPLHLLFRTAAGETSAEFPLHKRRERAGAFQGLGQDDVLYLIMPDRFADGDASNEEPVPGAITYDRSKPRAFHGGDLRGVLDHLDYLRDLGVTAVWLNPLYANDSRSPEDYHGYGPVDYYAVDKHFGTLKGFQELVDAAHAHGIKVILDQVLNHTGPRHPWVEAPPERDWFHGTQARHRTSEGDMLRLADPHAPPLASKNLVEGWFAGILPDLNQENPEVAQYLLQNSIWWAEESGLDGFRLDTFPYISRRFWANWHEGLRRTEPGLTTVGEVFHKDSEVTAFFDGGRVQFDGVDSGATAVFDYPLFFALRGVCLRGESFASLVRVMQRDWLYAHPERLVTFLGNHDVKRWMSEPGATPRNLMLGYSLLLTLRGIPQIYYGDEIAMRGGEDPDNRRDFPGGFPGDARDAFAAIGRSPEEQQIFSHVQTLLRLRRDHAALRRGRQWNLFWDEDAFAFAREDGAERLLVVANASSTPKKVEVPLEDTPLQGAKSIAVLLGTGKPALKDGGAEVELAGQSLSVFTLR